MSVFNTKISFGSLLKRTHSESEAAQFGRNARSDWQVVCFIFLFLNVVSIGVSVFVYRQINKGELFLVDKKETVSVRSLDRFELERTVAYFEEKQSRFDLIQQKPFSTVDPFVPKVVPSR